MIPSPAPLFKEPSLWLGFCISAAGLSIELRSIIRRQRLTPSGPARRARRSTPSALVRAGHQIHINGPPRRSVFVFLTGRWEANDHLFLESDCCRFFLFNVNRHDLWLPPCQQSGKNGSGHFTDQRVACENFISFSSMPDKHAQLRLQQHVKK